MSLQAVISRYFLPGAHLPLLLRLPSLPPESPPVLSLPEQVRAPPEQKLPG